MKILGITFLILGAGCIMVFACTCMYCKAYNIYINYTIIHSMYIPSGIIMLCGAILTGMD